VVVAGEKKLPRIRISRQHGRPQKCIQTNEGRQEMETSKTRDCRLTGCRCCWQEMGWGKRKDKSHTCVDVNGRYGRREEGRWGRGREEVRPQTSAHPRLARKSKGTQQRLIHTIRPQRTGMCLQALLISNASPFFHVMLQQVHRLVLPRPRAGPAGCGDLIISCLSMGTLLFGVDPAAPLPRTCTYMTALLHVEAVGLQPSQL
jgi:hypothetical protein